jgi:hypothetical protein
MQSRRPGGRGSRSGPQQTLGQRRHRGRRTAPPGVPAGSTPARRRVRADPQRENREEARRSRTRAHPPQPPRNLSWCLTGVRGRGKKRGGDGGRLYRPWVSRRRRAGGTFPSPARARQGHLLPAQSAPKSPAQRHAEPSPLATVENGVREEPGGGGGFASSGPGRGRRKGGQTRKWAPGSAAEPTGHPFKHALSVRLCTAVCTVFFTEATAKRALHLSFAFS